MRRRRRRNSISLVTAVLIELSTMIVIVALAQPTWTRGVIEQVSARRVAVDSRSTFPRSAPIRASVKPSNPTEPAPTTWQLTPHPVPTGNSSLRVAGNDRWESFSDRVAQPWPNEPIYPPAAGNFDTPTVWNRRY